MDVEKIQRINNLAIELQKQGLALSKEDAISQAEKIFNADEKTVLDGSGMVEGSLQVRSPVAGYDVPSNENTPKLTDESITRILKTNTDFLVKTIKEFNERMQTLESELVSVKQKLAQVASRPAVVARPAPSPASAQAAPTAVAETQAAPVKETTNPQGGDHPRSGGYNDSDVSIEKFFYMGHK